ncbi:MAG: hypothetical protein ACRD29_09695 [Acidimicrobiales bacterium]
MASRWTPDAMRRAVPLDRITLNRTDATGASQTVPLGATLTVEPTAPQVAAPIAPMAFPHGGGPWSGGGEVANTAGRVFFTYQGRPASCSGNAGRVRTAASSSPPGTA